MKKILIVDGHSDFIEKSLDKKIHIDSNNLMFNLDDAYRFRPYIEFAAIFIHTKYLNGSADIGYKRVISMIDNFEKEYLLFKDKYNLKKITNYNSLNKVMLENKIGLVLTIENLGFIGDEILKINELYDRGVRIMSLTWNDKNTLGCGARVNIDTGLTKFGKKCISKMNNLNLILDTSHLSKNSFKDAMYCEVKNVVATHSCVRKICENLRNLEDIEIKYIASKGGVIGINLYKEFLTQKNYATIDDVIDHITYISNLVGVNHVGLGSDFDGIEIDDLPIGIKGVGDLDNLIDRMITRGFSNYEIKKIMGGNWFSFLLDVI